MLSSKSGGWSSTITASCNSPSSDEGGSSAASSIGDDGAALDTGSALIGGPCFRLVPKICFVLAVPGT